jgi:hypothetical protein
MSTPRDPDDPDQRDSSTTGTPRRGFLSATVAGAAGLTVGGTLGSTLAGDDPEPVEDDPYGPVPDASTPPLPGDDCAGSPRVDAIQARAAAVQAAASATAEELMDPNTITVVTAGTGSPVPSPDRAQAATAVFVGGQFLLFDAGDGAARSLETLDLPVVDLTARRCSHGTRCQPKLDRSTRRRGV